MATGRGAGCHRRSAAQLSSSATTPNPSPRGAFCASQGPEVAPGVPCPSPNTPRAGHTRAFTCGPYPAVPPGGSYLSPAPGWAPAPRLPPPRSLQPPRRSPGTARRPRFAASKPAPEGRGGKRRLGHRSARPCTPHPAGSHGPSGTPLTPGSAAPGSPRRHFPMRTPPAPQGAVPVGAWTRLWSTWRRRRDARGPRGSPMAAERGVRQLPRRRAGAPLSSRPFEHRSPGQRAGGGQVSAGGC